MWLAGCVYWSDLSAATPDEAVLVMAPGYGNRMTRSLARSPARHGRTDGMNETCGCFAIYLLH